MWGLWYIKATTDSVTQVQTMASIKKHVPLHKQQKLNHLVKLQSEALCAK